MDKKTNDNMLLGKYLYFIGGILIMLFGLWVLCITEHVSSVIILGICVLIGIQLLRVAKEYEESISQNAIVMVSVSDITVEECEDLDSGTYYMHCVYVDYEYNGEEYKKIYWYGVSDTVTKPKSTLEKELSQFPEIGEEFQVYISPQKPNKILSGAPFKTT